MMDEYIRIMALAAFALMPPARSAEFSEGAGVPVRAELISCLVDFTESNPVTRLRFRLYPREEGWVLRQAWVPYKDEGYTRDASFPASVDNCNSPPGSVELSVDERQAPPENRLFLQGKVRVSLVKKGRSLPPQTIVMGKSGVFDPGGVCLRYTSIYGCDVLTSSNFKMPSELHLTCPEDVDVASVTAREGAGPEHEASLSARRGQEFTYSLEGIDNRARLVTVTVTLGERSETRDVPIQKVVSLGEDVDWQLQRGMPIPKLSSYPFPDKRRENTAIAWGSVALLPETIDLRREWIGGEPPGLHLSFKCQICNQQNPFLPGISQKVIAQDQQGRELTGVYQYSERNRNLVFHFDQVPLGEWIELQAIELCRLTRERSLPVKVISLESSGAFDAGPLCFRYIAAPWNMRFAGASLLHALPFTRCALPHRWSHGHRKGAWPSGPLTRAYAPIRSRQRDPFDNSMLVSFSCFHGEQIVRMSFRNDRGENWVMGRSHCGGRSTWDVWLLSRVKKLWVQVTIAEKEASTLAPLHVRVGLGGVQSKEASP